MVASNVNTKRAAICTPSCLHVDLIAKTACFSFSVMVTTTSVSVPRRCLEAMAIVFSDVHLGTAGCATTTRITIRVAILWEGEIEVVVHIVLCPAQVHVELHKTTSQIEGRFGAHAPTTMDGPAVGIELGAAIIDIEV